MAFAAPVPRQAVLLAAGEGSRLRPLTDHVPKPLLPIDGRAVIDTLVAQLRALGVERYIVVVGYHGDTLRTYLDRTWGAELDLRYVEQPERLGSAHALQCALAAPLERCDTIVAGTDTVWRDDDVAAVARRDAERSLVTMALRRWPLEQLPHRSCATVDERMRVRRVLEKPTAAQVDSALSGSPLYVFRSAFWPYVAELGADPSGGVMELATALQRAIDDGHEVLGVEVHDTRDITRAGDLLRFNFPYLRAYVPEL